MTQSKRIALVHDWTIHMRGGEKVLEALAELYPDATIYTLFCRRPALSSVLQKMKIKTSWLQHVPGIFKMYRWFLPLFPMAVKSLKIDEADLVISSSHCVAKGINIPAGAVHICYCHTPMRYLWGFESEYFENYPFFMKWLIRWIFKGLKKWDYEVNKSVDYFIANSENVKERIRRFYGRDAEVIHPPLDTVKFYPAAANRDETKREYYLVVSAFVPYKRVDIVIKTFNVLPRSLMIVGSGPLEGAYRRLRTSERISFLGSLADADLRELYSGAKALIFPTSEDFGIVPLEAQACGTPVIAFGEGGALESVREGVFFGEQTPEALSDAILQFETRRFDRVSVAKSVESFNTGAFKEKIINFINRLTVKDPQYVAGA